MRDVSPRLLLVALVLATAIHSIFYWLGFYGISWDDAARTLDAYQWLHEPRIVHAMTWLPFHRIVIGSALAIHPDLFVTPRVVTFFFGLGELVMLTWLAAELFRDRQVTNTTALFTALFMPRVVLALAPLSAAPFDCATVAAMAALARWLRTASRASLIFAAMAFAAATTIRYEGWGFAAAFGAIVLACWWQDRARVASADLILCGVIVAAFPCFWLGLNGIERGNMFASLTGTGTVYADWQSVWRKNPLTEFLIINGLTLSLIGLGSVVAWASRESRFRKFLFVAAAPLLCSSIFLIVAKRAQSGPAWRMIGTWCLLLVPFTMDVLNRLRRRFPKNGVWLAPAALAGMSLLSVVDTYRMWQQSLWAVPPVTRAIGRDLNERLTASPAPTRVLIESSTYSYLNLLVASQSPDRFVLNSEPERLDDPLTIVSAERPLPIAELERRNIGFLVFRTQALRAFLDRQTSVRRVADYGEWAVYERRT